MKTEDDTFKRLKGLTFEEVDNIRRQIYTEISIKTGNGAVRNIDMREKLNPIITPYGWSYDSFMSELFGEEIWERVK